MRVPIQTNPSSSWTSPETKDCGSPSFVERTLMDCELAGIKIELIKKNKNGSTAHRKTDAGLSKIKLVDIVNHSKVRKIVYITGAIVCATFRDLPGDNFIFIYKGKERFKDG
ncbi:MAG: hypothetical protein WDO19_17145 [Bacteroidota bacterium]